MAIEDDGGFGRNETGSDHIAGPNVSTWCDTCDEHIEDCECTACECECCQYRRELDELGDDDFESRGTDVAIALADGMLDH